MDEIVFKHKLNNDTDDENSCISNKRLKNSPTDENFDPASSVEKRGTINHRVPSARSASKSSPLSSVLISEMGFGVLDSDESNQSSFNVNSIASSAPPSSALSMIPNDNNSDDSNINGSDLAEAFSESESNIEYSSHNTMSDVNLSSSEAFSLPTIPGSESKHTDFHADMQNAQFQVYQDSTPAALIPCTRTSFRGILNSVQTMSNNGQSTSTSSTTTFAHTSDTFANPPGGRAIRGNSMKKFQKEKSDTDSPMKHKGRSPLATIGNATPVQVLDANDLKKSFSAEDSFFMYQKRDPRFYTGEDNFAKLSDEVLLSIFKWLPKKTLSRCSLVNHRFHRVTQDESLWARLDLGGKTIQPFALGRILLRGVMILRLAQCKILEPIFDPSQIQKDFLSRLKYLDLSMAVISTESAFQLFSKCKQLRKLSLEHVPVNDGVCKAIAQNRKLEVLNLAMSSGITPYGIRKIASMKHLNTLNIAWTSLDIETLREFSNHVNENMLRLNIAGCRKTMSDDILMKIVSRCSQLQELDLSDCTGLSTQTIGVVSSLKKLEYLSLSRCYNINVSAYLEISKLESLEFLDIFGVLSDQALTILTNNFPDVGINKYKHSAVARPTVGTRRTSIWGLRTRD